MKKKILNLSLLMLLSAQFNVSAMFKDGANAYTAVVSLEPSANVENALTAVESAIKALDKRSEGLLQTSLNKAIDTIKNLDQLSLANFRQSVNYERLIFGLNELGCKLSQFKSETIKGLHSAYFKAIDGSKNLAQIAKDYPKFACAVGFGAVAGSGLVIYNLLRDQGMVAEKTDSRSIQTTTTSEADTGLKSQSDAAKDLLEEHTQKVNKLVKNLDFKKTKDFFPFIDYIIGNNLENELLEYNHLPNNDARTLLMLLSENYWLSIPTYNFDALLYLLQQIRMYNSQNPGNPKKIDFNKKDRHGRSALFYAAFYGLLNIVQSLLEQGAEVTAMDLDAAKYKNDFGVSEAEYKKIYDLLAEKLA
jgi:hypothetical protein